MHLIQFRKLTYILAIAFIMIVPPTAQAQFSLGLGGELPDFVELAETAGKAVVNISTVQTVQPGQQQFNPRGQTPFDEFFRQFEGMPGAPTPEQWMPPGPMGPQERSSLGSGFVISEDGFIVTNSHVVTGADEIKVRFKDEDTGYEARIIGLDPESDLAILKIDADRKLPTLKFADPTDDIDVGEWVLAIGNPFGLGHTVTAGIISGKGRVLGAGPYDDFLQTDASINPGNSGGPLVNLEGEVVGINSAIIPNGQGLGFAIPSTMAVSIIDQLKKGEKIHRGWLGIQMQNIDEKSAKALGLDEPHGVLVADAFKGDPAYDAGIRAGDVIIEVNGDEVETPNDLSRAIGSLPPGDTAKIKVMRKGEKKTFSVTLEERDTQAFMQGGPTPKPVEPSSEMGIFMRPPNEQEAKALGLDSPEGLFVTNVQAGSASARAGLLPGDLILQVNQIPVSSAREFINAAKAGNDNLAILLIKRPGRNLFLTIPVE